MSGLSLSQYLRPYAVRSTPVNTAVYSRFYSAAGLVCPRRCTPTRPSAKAATVGLRRFKSDKSKSTEAASAMSPESSRIATEKRVQKLESLEALKWPRIENAGVVDPVSIPQFRAKYRDLAAADQPTELIELRGRIMAIRNQSSRLTFIDILGDFETVQVMLDARYMEKINAIELEQFKTSRAPLLRGDFISVRGAAVVSSQGELTLKATDVPSLLSPSLAPVPTSLINEETKVQSRHLALLVSKQAAQTLRFRSELIWWMRNFFVNKDFLEVQTPILADYASGATARPFLTSATEFPHKELALRIAPELWLKRLVVGGFDKIFEIGPSFRNEGLDGTHNPEFTMCEFYQAYASLPSLIQLTEDFVRSLAAHSSKVWKGQPAVEEAFPPSYFQDFEQFEFIPVLEAALNVKLPDLEQPNALAQLRELLGDRLDSDVQDASLNKTLDTLASIHIEPRSENKPIFITHHPACMSPLSKSFRCPKTGQLVSARAELFMKGREIANMYEEENSPIEQRRKFELQVEARNAAKPDPDEGQALVDESYIQALEHGLPPTGGWGCGVDRLVMMFSGATRINDTLSFGNLRNVVGTSNVAK
jgi:lysyl-tRNA synthetase, class II